MMKLLLVKKSLKAAVFLELFGGKFVAGQGLGVDSARLGGLIISMSL